VGRVDCGGAFRAIPKSECVQKNLALGPSPGKIRSSWLLNVVPADAALRFAEAGTSRSPRVFQHSSNKLTESIQVGPWKAQECWKARGKKNAQAHSGVRRGCSAERLKLSKRARHGRLGLLLHPRGHKKIGSARGQAPSHRDGAVILTRSRGEKCWVLAVRSNRSQALRKGGRPSRVAGVKGGVRLRLVLKSAGATTNSKVGRRARRHFDRIRASGSGTVVIGVGCRV